MKAWQRKSSLGGPRIKSVMEGHEVRILHSLVSNVIDMLEQRRDSAPRDELADITGMRSGHSEAPDQAPLARLLPDFHRPEEGAADDADGQAVSRAHNSGMRMLHEPEIIDAKLSAAAVVLRTLPSRGGAVSLTPEQGEAWMGCLNDVRLGLGALLLEAGEKGPDGPDGANGPVSPDGSDGPDGATEADIPEQVPEDDPRSAHLDVYHWLTFMQDSLCTALIGQ